MLPDKKASRKSAFHALVVDDEYLICDMVCEALQLMDISVDMAKNGLQAKERILDGNYDLVITDIYMPEMDGKELLIWMQKHRPQIEGIVITGYDIPEIEEILSNGELVDIADCLTKPFQLADLQEAVKRCMNRRMGRKDRSFEISE